MRARVAEKVVENESRSLEIPFSHISMISQGVVVFLLHIWFVRDPPLISAAEIIFYPRKMTNTISHIVRTLQN